MTAPTTDSASQLAPVSRLTNVGRRLLVPTLLIGFGVVLGQLGPTATLAQDDPEPEEQLPEETANEIRAANRALVSARDELERQGLYVTATNGINTTLILSGGGNAIEDLEAGRGVDPETLASLYAGQAIPDVKQHLSVDDEGRLLYKNRIIRMYSKSRLTELAERRLRYSPVGR